MALRRSVYVRYFCRADEAIAIPLGMPFGFLPIAPIATRSEIGLRPAARRFTDRACR